VNWLAHRSAPEIEVLERATRLSPLDPLAHLVKLGFAMAHGHAGRHREALAGRPP